MSTFVCACACACACLGSTRSVAVQSSSQWKASSERRGNAAQAQKEKGKKRTEKMCLFDGDIPLSSEKGNRGFRGFFKNRGGRRRGTSDLTSAHMCAVGVTERRPSIMSQVPAGGTERVLRPAPRRLNEGL